jgi:hypothetical protein
MTPKDRLGASRSLLGITLLLVLFAGGRLRLTSIPSGVDDKSSVALLRIPFESCQVRHFELIILLYDIESVELTYPKRRMEKEED